MSEDEERTDRYEQQNKKYGKDNDGHHFFISYGSCDRLVL